MTLFDNLRGVPERYEAIVRFVWDVCYDLDTSCFRRPASRENVGNRTVAWRRIFASFDDELTSPEPSTSPLVAWHPAARSAPGNRAKGAIEAPHAISSVNGTRGRASDEALAGHLRGRLLTVVAILAPDRKE
jgi:hypothetical protein